MKFSDAIKSILAATIKEFAADPHNYAINPGRFFWLLLTMEGDCIKEELYRYFGRTTATPSKAAFYKQRQKIKQGALRSFLFLFNTKLKKELYLDKYQLIACDGSAVDIYRNPNDGYVL